MTDPITTTPASPEPTPKHISPTIPLVRDRERPTDAQPFTTRDRRIQTHLPACDVCGAPCAQFQAVRVVVPHVESGSQAVIMATLGRCCGPTLITKTLYFDKNRQFVWKDKTYVPTEVRKANDEHRRARENRIVRFGENAPSGTYASAWLCAVAALKETGLDWRSLTTEFMAEFTAVVLTFHRARLDGESFEQACTRHKTYAPGDAITKALHAYERARPKGVTAPSVRPVHRSLLTLAIDLDD
jgi:hypothetical protein